MKPYHQLIKGPIITEKTHALKEAANKLTFRVDLIEEPGQLVVEPLG